MYDLKPIYKSTHSNSRVFMFDNGGYIKATNQSQYLRNYDYSICDHQFDVMLVVECNNTAGVGFRKQQTTRIDGNAVVSGSKVRLQEEMQWFRGKDSKKHRGRRRK